MRFIEFIIRLSDLYVDKQIAESSIIFKVDGEDYTASIISIQDGKVVVETTKING